MSSDGIQTTRFSVPRLRTDPVLVAGCCATLAEDIIADELTRLAGVASVSVDQPGGIVTVTYDLGETTPEEIAAGLDWVEYPAADMPQPRRDQPASGPAENKEEHHAA